MKDITIEELRSKLDGRPVGVVGKRKEFAVLIPLIEEDGEVKLLFEVRSKDIRQPGDVCFPGGKIEEGESETEAALREMAEETGVDPEYVEVLGRFDSVLEVNRIRMHTAVGLMKEGWREQLDPDGEVAEIFTVPLKFFKETEPTVARTYRRAIDDWFEDPEKYRANMDWYRAEIRKCTYRRFTTGFYFGKPAEDSMVYESNTYVNESVFLGIVEETDPGRGARVTQRNKFRTGDQIEIMKPDGRNIPVRVLAIRNAAGEEVPDAPHPKEELWLTLSEMPDQGDMLRTGKE